VDPLAFGRSWVEAWNRRDLDAVLAHYADACAFTSPKALLVTGHARLEGKAALRAYWEAALVRFTRIVFRLDHVVWDAGARILVVVYQADLDGAVSRASEMMRFDAAGNIVEGEAFYGAAG
jgi:ketosteroid isomerase-like protein